MEMYGIKVAYYGAFLFVTGVSMSDIEDKYYVKIQKVEANLSKEVMRNLVQKVIPKDRYSSEMLIGFDLMREVRNVTIRGELFHKFSMEYKPFLVNITVNLCAAIQNKYQSFYVNHCLRILRNKKNGINITENFFHCPFKKGHYQLHYTFPQSQLKRFQIMPIGNYKTTITLWEEVDEESFLIGHLNVYDSHEHTKIRKT